MKRDSYLGDGVYLRWLNDEPWLVTDNGVEITNRIHLSPDVLTSLELLLLANRGDE